MNQPDPLFPESQEEREAREAFYATEDAKPGEYRVLSLSASGSIQLARPLKRGEQITIQVADADGVVIASGEGYIKGYGFSESEKQGIIIVERKHKAKLG